MQFIHLTHKGTSPQILTPHPIQTVLCPAHSLHHLFPHRLSGLISSHSSASANALSLFLMPLLPTVLSVAVLCYFLQDLPWSRTKLSTSAQGLTIGRVFFALYPPRTWERAACMATSSTKPRISPSGQDLSLWLPSTQ